MNIGQKLSLIRTKKKQNQKEFAKLLEVSDKTYWNYENNAQEITVSCLQILYGSLRVNLNWLLDDKNNNDAQMFLDSNNIPTSSDTEKMIEDKIKQVLGGLGVPSNLLKFVPRQDQDELE